MSELQSLAESFERMASALELGAGTLLVMAILYLSYWRNSVFIFALSGLVTLTIGLTWATSYPGFSYAFLFMSIYQFMKCWVLALETDKPAKGISQFKNIISILKTWF